ncbi:oligopeptide/dipeptide ABC transporter ATP-binding protein [Afifella sp. IM 167]|uniref:ABC transporter ATP-binding protein n=1 Tax=Afifella sp. IM 167 TaxID=2033586 RepID=UPI001CCBC8B4|nr:peptide ABC transporter ATP-binding protein [Afifella sp. IM 167]
MSADPILEVSNLTVHFQNRRSNPFAPHTTVHAVDDVSFSLPRGSTLGIVGESGSGKTTAALAVMRLGPITAGSVKLAGTEIAGLKGEELRLVRRKMQVIFQDPYSSLNPRMRAGQIVREPMDLLDVYDRSERADRVAELFAAVGLRPEQESLFPHQFSGGQRQRIGIARALATDPEIIVCDEPVSALDVAIQAQTLNLLRRLQKTFGYSYLFISHDLGVVQYVCDEIAVMYLGQIVEHAVQVDLFRRPLHPYTWALMSAVPSANLAEARQRRVLLTGDPPNPIDPPDACRFAERCPFAEEICRKTAPPLRAVANGRKVACHLVSDDGEAPQHREGLEGP